MISSMTRQAIHHMGFLKGRSVREITIAAQEHFPDEGVSERSVRRILKEVSCVDGEVDVSRAAVLPGRPSVVEPFRDRIVALLEESPLLKSAEVFRRARTWGYSGAKTALYEFVKSVRRPVLASEPLVPFEGLPGEFAQFDFGERSVIFAEGRRKKVIFFVGRLKFSRHLHVVIVPNQTAEVLVRAVVSCLNAWKCVPLVWVFDNPKTVRISGKGESIRLHPYLHGLAGETNSAVTLCTPHQPQQKGSVERGVGWVKNSFLSQRSFVDEADLEAQLAQWLIEVNTLRPHGITKEIPVKRLEREQSVLMERQVPWTSSEYALRIPAQVLPTGMVHIAGTSYSVDPRKVGAPAMVLLHEKSVVIQIGGTQCIHKRIDHFPVPQRLDEHRRDILAVIHGERKKNTYKRQCLWELGDTAQRFLEILIHRLRPPTAWAGPVNRLFALLEEHGAEPLLEAMLESLRKDTITVSSVVSALHPQNQEVKQ